MYSRHLEASPSLAQRLRIGLPGGWGIAPLGEVIALVIPRLPPRLEDLGMDDVLVAQVADDDPVRQQAWLVHQGRCRDDPWVGGVLLGQGFLREY
jgi:hypothetical protein